jgi:hypothetical protein
MPFLHPFGTNVEPGTASRDWGTRRALIVASMDGTVLRCQDEKSRQIGHRNRCSWKSVSSFPRSGSHNSGVHTGPPPNTKVDGRGEARKSVLHGCPPIFNRQRCHQTADSRGDGS